VVARYAATSRPIASRSDTDMPNAMSRVITVPSTESLVVSSGPAPMPGTATSSGDCA
jgi:hypothetical protein